jgi:hypothetical protein
LKNALEPYAQATKLLEGDKYPTLSIVMKAWTALLSDDPPAPTVDPRVIQLVEELKSRALRAWVSCVYIA